jgi:hypothetical protein
MLYLTPVKLYYHIKNNKTQCNKKRDILYMDVGGWCHLFYSQISFPAESNLTFTCGGHLFFPTFKIFSFSFLFLSFPSPLSRFVPSTP